MADQTTSETVAIVVVPRDRFSTFPRCLQALYAHTDVPFRLTVVAGAPDRATEEYLFQFQSQKNNISVLLVDQPLTQGESRNIAIRQLAERFCVVLEKFGPMQLGEPVLDSQVNDFLRYRMPLARKLREAGYEVHVALPGEPGLENISNQGIPCHIFYLQRLSTRPWDELRSFMSLLRLGVHQPASRRQTGLLKRLRVRQHISRTS